MRYSSSITSGPIPSPGQRCPGSRGRSGENGRPGACSVIHSSTTASTGASGGSSGAWGSSGGKRTRPRWATSSASSARCWPCPSAYSRSRWSERSRRSSSIWKLCQPCAWSLRRIPYASSAVRIPRAE
ncbi:MAG: hypothetical protein D6776_06010 [Planctomycetota bacterium]|nr:MAG: hypothetical protein D6776_06010 [Planctomycetota bacterium]